MLKQIFAGYGIFREGKLCDYFEDLNKTKKERKIYIDCYEDKLTKIYPVVILQDSKEIK